VDQGKQAQEQMPHPKTAGRGSNGRGLSRRIFLSGHLICVMLPTFPGIPVEGLDGLDPNATELRGRTRRNPDAGEEPLGVVAEDVVEQPSQAEPVWVHAKLPLGSIAAGIAINGGRSDRGSRPNVGNRIETVPHCVCSDRFGEQPLSPVITFLNKLLSLSSDHSSISGMIVLLPSSSLPEGSYSITPSRAQARIRQRTIMPEDRRWSDDSERVLLRNVITGGQGLPAESIGEPDTVRDRLDRLPSSRDSEPLSLRPPWMADPAAIDPSGSRMTRRVRPGDAARRHPRLRRRAVLALRRDFCAFLPQSVAFGSSPSKPPPRIPGKWAVITPNQMTGKEYSSRQPTAVPIRAQQSRMGDPVSWAWLALIHSPEPPDCCSSRTGKGVYPKRLEE